MFDPTEQSLTNARYTSTYEGVRLVYCNVTLRVAYEDSADCVEWVPQIHREINMWTSTMHYPNAII